MRYLWIWVGANALAQLFDLIYSSLLVGATTANQCMIIQGS